MIRVTRRTSRIVLVVTCIIIVLVIAAGAVLITSRITKPDRASEQTGITAAQQDQRMGMARETTEGQRAAIITGTARQRAEERFGTTLTDEELPDCLKEKMTVSQATACARRITQAVKEKHDREEAAKQAEEQRKAEEAARAKAEQDAASQEANEEQQPPVNQPEGNQTNPEPAPVQQEPVNHATVRTCYAGQGKPQSECAWAINLGGLVKTTYDGGPGETLIDYAAHNNEGGAWILDVKVGDEVIIDGEHYRATKLRDFAFNEVDPDPIMLQTCLPGGERARFVTLERA
ncbi:hypothetical protein [Bifidobacterium vansinderenii]|uniref:Sortase n=1 Tax=Bifidobacterium vansinderenii TaxID=1984871 RepID=A0A229VXP9_9BIFI|nr:hypothetical protein [Bifidobacterium vansinderenii]OXN00408.1 hypothetical protein Tam10B_1278 [Bifidobacterium vansinderenii]